MVGCRRGGLRQGVWGCAGGDITQIVLAVWKCSGNKINTNLSTDGELLPSELLFISSYVLKSAVSTCVSVLIKHVVRPHTCSSWNRSVHRRLCLETLLKKLK